MIMSVPPSTHANTTPHQLLRPQAPAEPLQTTEAVASPQQSSTYQQLAEQDTTELPLLPPSPPDTLHITQQPPVSTQTATAVPAVYPLLTSTQTLPPVTPFNTTPIGKHLQKWGIISAGVGVGTLAMGAILGSNQQQWHPNKALTPAQHATPQQPYIVELLTEQPRWWEGKQSAQTQQYTAIALIPNSPWVVSEVPHAHISLQPQKSFALKDASGTLRLSIQQNAIKNSTNAMQPFLTVTTYKPAVLTADSIVSSGGEKEHVLNIVWDTNTKKMSAFGHEVLPKISGTTEKAIIQCLEWFHCPESLKEGLKPKNNLHLTGLMENIPLAAVFAGITSLVGAGLWLFNKPPKPLLAKENSLEALPTA